MKKALVLLLLLLFNFAFPQFMRAFGTQMHYKKKAEIARYFFFFFILQIWVSKISEKKIESFFEYRKAFLTIFKILPVERVS